MAADGVTDAPMGEDDAGNGAAAAAGGGDAGGGDIPPNETIYINNLNEKVKTDKLKVSLYAVFGQFGKVMQIVASRSLRLRGQAWVVFDSVEAASKALQQMQGFVFFDKPMRIAFAKSKSDVIAKREGTFVPREKRTRDEDGGVPSAKRAPGAGGAGGAKKPIPAQMRNPPNSKLLVQNLPESTTDEALRKLFGQYPGVTDVRVIAARNLAFVEYASEQQATVALQSLNNFKIEADHPLVVSYAKK